MEAGVQSDCISGTWEHTGVVGSPCWSPRKSVSVEVALTSAPVHGLEKGGRFSPGKWARLPAGVGGTQASCTRWRSE